MIITSLTRNKKDIISVEDIKSKSQEITEALSMSCHICTQPYNSTDTLPISVCPEQHTYCLTCVENLFERHQARAVRCPTCRLVITRHTVRTNKTIFRLCDVVPKVAQKCLQIQRQKKEIEGKYQKLISELQKKKIREQLHSNKENSNKNSRIRNHLSDLPQLDDNQQSKNIHRVNVHSFLAQRKRTITFSDRRLFKNKVDQVSVTKRLV